MARVIHLIFIFFLIVPLNFYKLVAIFQPKTFRGVVIELQYSLFLSDNFDDGAGTLDNQKETGVEFRHQFRAGRGEIRQISSPLVCHRRSGSRPILLSRRP